MTYIIYKEAILFPTPTDNILELVYYKIKLIYLQVTGFVLSAGL